MGTLNVSLGSLLAESVRHGSGSGQCSGNSCGKGASRTSNDSLAKASGTANLTGRSRQIK
jgi:hypothetical protein